MQKLIASIVLRETETKTALHGMNHTGLISVVFGIAPPAAPEANGAVHLIEDTIPLPGRLLLRSRSYLRGLYCRQELSAHEIARRLGVSHSTVLDALRAAGLVNGESPNGHHKRKGQVPFGFVYIDQRLVKCKEEQNVIRLARQLRRNGCSLREIAAELNRRLVPTKNHGVWQPNTVKKILDRVEGR